MSYWKFSTSHHSSIFFRCYSPSPSKHGHSITRAFPTPLCGSETRSCAYSWDNEGSAERMSAECSSSLEKKRSMA